MELGQWRREVYKEDPLNQCPVRRALVILGKRHSLFIFLIKVTLKGCTVEWEAKTPRDPAVYGECDLRGTLWEKEILVSGPSRVDNCHTRLDHTHEKKATEPMERIAAAHTASIALKGHASISSCLSSLCASRNFSLPRTLFFPSLCPRCLPHCQAHRVVQYTWNSWTRKGIHKHVGRPLTSRLGIHWGQLPIKITCSLVPKLGLHVSGLLDH